MQSHVLLARPSNVSFFRRVSRRHINLFRITGRPSLLACDCRTQVTFFDQRRARCLPRGCKSELDDPPGFSPRPVIRLRPRPRFPLASRATERRFTCERDVKFIPCDNSRQDTPRSCPSRSGGAYVVERTFSRGTRSELLVKEQGETKRTRHREGRGVDGTEDTTVCMKGLSSSLGGRELHLPRHTLALLYP